MQIGFSIHDRGLLPALARLTAFFTILTNALVAAVAWAMALGRTSGLGGAHMRLTAVNSIVLVGLIYFIALQAVDHPQGVGVYTNPIFHRLSPVLFLLAWLAGPHGALRWRDVLPAIAWPLGYCIYAMARGAVDGFYPYWFLDPAKLPAATFAFSIAVLTAVFAGFALAFVAIDRKLAASPLA